VPGQAFTWTVRVYYEDTDTGGVVYYANYLKFFERARTEWLRAAGVAQQALASEHGLDDLIDVDVRVVQAGRASVSFQQTARRGTEVLAQARVRAGCVDTITLAPKSMPATMREAIEALLFSEPMPS
jgi:acyl-CoA thioester hydrolase